MAESEWQKDQRTRSSFFLTPINDFYVALNTWEKARVGSLHDGESHIQPIVVGGPLALSFVLYLTPLVIHPGKPYCPWSVLQHALQTVSPPSRWTYLPNKDSCEFIQCTGARVLPFSASVLLCYTRAGITSHLSSLPSSIVPSKHFGSFWSVLVHSSPFCSFSLLWPHPYPHSSLLLSFVAISCF